jgi:3'-phosphoadenosine 5'-phosphosulfate (PAPS) 3'-phosphatase
MTPRYRGDLNVSVAPNDEWDECPGDLLVREAGGAVLAFTARGGATTRPTR